MRRANRFFHESVEEGRYVTLFYMVFDVPAKSLLYVNAGHVPPVLVRENGEVELLEEGGCRWACSRRRATRGTRDARAGRCPGLYTDGIVEQTNPEGEEYGSSRLITTLRQAGQAGATELCSRVMQDVHRFGAGKQVDDRTAAHHPVERRARGPFLSVVTACIPA